MDYSLLFCFINGCHYYYHLGLFICDLAERLEEVQHASY